MQPRTLVLALMATGAFGPGVVRAQIDGLKPVKPEENCAVMFVYAATQICSLLSNGLTQCQPVGVVGPAPNCPNAKLQPLMPVPLSPPVIQPPATAARPYGQAGATGPYAVPYAWPFGQAPYAIPYAGIAALPPVIPAPQAIPRTAVPTATPVAKAEPAVPAVPPRPETRVNQPTAVQVPVPPAATAQAPVPASGPVAAAPARPAATQPSEPVAAPAAPPAAMPTPPSVAAPAPAAPAAPPVAKAPTPPTPPAPPVAAAPTSPAPAAPPIAAAPTLAAAPVEAPGARAIEDALAHFEFDSATLTDKGRALLDAWLAQYPRGTPVRITGHADRLGPEPYNLKLSQRRAEAVRQYLLDKGVAAKDIEIIAKGESEPVKACKGGATPRTKACLAPNRRVVIDPE